MFDDDLLEQETYWDDLLEWETEQVFRDQEGAVLDEEADDYDLDLYDQYEYMLDHLDE